MAENINLITNSSHGKRQPHSRRHAGVSMKAYTVDSILDSIWIKRKSRNLLNFGRYYTF